MEMSRNDALAERVERLERENQRLKRIGSVALVGTVALLVAGAKGADGPKVVEAEGFVLRGQDGRERGSLGVNSVGTAWLSVQDREGQRGVDLIVPADGGEPYVDVWSKAGGHVKLTAGEERLGVDILDKKRGGLMALGVEHVNGNRSQYLSILEPGKGNLSLGLNSDGSGGLGVAAPNHERRIELWNRVNDGPYLRMHDREQKQIVRIPPP